MEKHKSFNFFHSGIPHVVSYSTIVLIYALTLVPVATVVFGLDGGALDGPPTQSPSSPPVVLRRAGLVRRAGHPAPIARTRIYQTRFSAIDTFCRTIGAGVIISSDIGGSDEDDIQSLIHYLLYSDLFDTEGIISSPPGKGRKIDILKVIDVYQKDYPNLKTWSDKYPTPDYLRSISKQGAIDPAPQQGYSSPTEGSQWIIHCANKKDKHPLYVLVWGSITDVAQALHDDPRIKQNIRVHFIASWNLKQDPNAFAYIDNNHPDLWLIYNNSTFRGWYIGGRQDGDFGNKSFVDKYVKGHGALGEYFATLKGGSIKMGDTPSYAYLLRGNPDDPTKESWGGRFIRKEGRPDWWVDDPDPALKEADHPGAKTVNKWRQEYLSDWQKRMDRCKSQIQ